MTRARPGHVLSRANGSVRAPFQPRPWDEPWDRSALDILIWCGLNFVGEVFESLLRTSPYRAANVSGIQLTRRTGAECGDAHRSGERVPCREPAAKLAGDYEILKPRPRPAVERVERVASRPPAGELEPIARAASETRG